MANIKSQIKRIRAATGISKGNTARRAADMASDDPERTRAELIAEYQQKFNNPYVAASRGYLDDVIDPADTRRWLLAGLRSLPPAPVWTVRSNFQPVPATLSPR